MKHLLLALMLLISWDHCFANEKRVTFATGEWPPYTSESLPEYGAASALITAICMAGGIQPVYQFYPWKRAELEVASGRVFAAFPYAITETRKQEFDFSESLYSTVTVLMYSTNNPRTRISVAYQKPADLRGFIVGGVLGGFYKPILEKSGVVFEGTSTIEKSIRKLEAGRIDFCIGGQIVLYDAVKRTFPESINQFKTLSKSFSEKTPATLMVSRKYPKAREILEKFHIGLAAVKNSGEYDRIIEKYQMAK